MNSEQKNYSKLKHLGKRQKGVVLLAVIGFLLIASLLISSASVLMENRLDIATQSQENFFNKAQANTKMHQLTYLLATQRLTIAGIGQGKAPDSHETDEDGYFVNRTTGDELRVDGYTYADEDGISYSIQNKRGLLGINASEQRWLDMYLQTSKVSRLNRRKMLDSLRDYADENDIQTASGKESSDTYNTRNYLLQSCFELYSVAFWPEYLHKTPKFIERCTIRRSSLLNVNAVPITLWAKIFPNSVNAIRQMRSENRWFTSLTSIGLVESGFVTIPDEYYSVLGGNQFAINVSVGDVNVKRHIQIGENLAEPFVFTLN